jgi:hypothetical protein
MYRFHRVDAHCDTFIRRLAGGACPPLSPAFKSTMAASCSRRLSSPRPLRNLLLTALVISPTAGHTNAVGVIAVQNSGDNSKYDITIFFGTWHTPAAAEGALALYGYTSGDTNAAASYTTERYGKGGTVSDATYAMVAPANVGSSE